MISKPIANTVVKSTKTYLSLVITHLCFGYVLIAFLSCPCRVGDESILDTLGHEFQANSFMSNLNPCVEIVFGTKLATKMPCWWYLDYH